MIPRIGFEKVVVSLKVNVQIVDDDDDSARDIGKGRIKLVTSTVEHRHTRGSHNEIKVAQVKLCISPKEIQNMGI